MKRHTHVPELQSAKGICLGPWNSWLPHMNGPLPSACCFGIIQNIFVSIVLGTTLIDRFVKGILLAEKKVVPYNSKSLPIATLIFLTLEENLKDSSWKTSIPLVASESMKPQKVQLVGQVKR